MINANSNLVFYAERKDGLGARLIPLFIAAALAKRHGGEMRFSWPEIPIMRLGSNAIQTAERTFTYAYREKHMDKAPKPLQRLSIYKLIDNRQPYHGNYMINLYPDTQYLEAVVEGVLGQLDTDALFQEIGFTSRLISAYRRGRAAGKDKVFSALHLRSGDIVYGPQRFFGLHSAKAVPFPLVAEVAKRETIKGIEIIVFAEEPSLPSILKSRYNASLAIENEGRFGDAAEQAFFDIGLMSCAETIYGAESSFSTISALIGKAQISNPYKLFSAVEAGNICERCLAISNLGDGYQRAYWIYAAYANFKEDLPVELRLRYLAKAHKEDPTNKLYELTRASEAINAGLGNLDIYRILAESQNFQERGAIWEILQHRASKPMVGIFRRACEISTDPALAICVAYHLHHMNNQLDAGVFSGIFLASRPHSLCWLDCMALGYLTKHNLTSLNPNEFAK